MTIKTILTFLCLLILTNTFAQNEEFSIIGKWRQIEYQGNDGAKDYVQKIKNGEILSFEANNILTDNVGNMGSYELNNDHLKLNLKNHQDYFLAYYNNQNLDTLYLAPANSKYQCICDEGCLYTYAKQKDTE